MGKVNATYPADHEPAMRVPKGGSSCSSCEYLGKDRKTCTNEHYSAFYKTNKLQAPADEFCSDWYEAAKKVEKKDHFFGA